MCGPVPILLSQTGEKYPISEEIVLKIMIAQIKRKLFGVEVGQLIWFYRNII